MTNDEILLFGRFLQDKSMTKNYGWFYENHRFDRRSLETFLEQADAEDAILSAFDLAGAPNTIFNPKFWQGLNNKWMKRLQDFRDGGSRLEADLIRCDHCGRMVPRSSFVLNAKGQLHKHCRECESGEWDRRRKEEEAAAKEKEKQEKAVRQLEKEIAEKQAKLERLTAEQQAKAEDGKTDKTTKVCDHCGQRKLRQEFDESGTSPDGLQSWCRECQAAAARVSADSDIVYERRRKAEAVAASDETDVRTAPRLGEHDATLHYKDGSRRIVFNSVLSSQVQAAGLTKCYLSTERDGRQFLVFNDSEGANVTIAGTSSRSQGLSQVHSVSICRQVAERFRLAYGELYYLHITKNLSKLRDTINVEVKQVHTREEFAAIAARREEQARLVPGRDVPEYEGTDGKETADMPLIDFSGEQQPEEQASPKKEAVQKVTAAPDRVRPDQSLMIPLTGRKPADILQQLIDRGHLSERDIAKFLYNMGWKLQEPVVVTTHKKFKA